jgi:hypothetical protein
MKRPTAPIGLLTFFFASSIFAQGPSGSGPPGDTPVSQVQEYNSSWEEYLALKELADGGTEHTFDTLPDWRGVWRREIHPPMFAFDNSVGGREDLPAYGRLSAELTPRYAADYEHQIAMVKAGTEWDRLSDCLPAGFPRWLTEPWLREFIPTPDETWLSHEQINETRRIYTDGRDHIPDADAIPLWLGDSIGFWNGGTLVVHTNHLKAGTYQRGQPAYSFQISTIEQWRKLDSNTMEVKVTVYDPPALRKPWHAEFRYIRAADPNARVDYNSCEENNNVVRRPDGGATFVLPGEPGYTDPRTFGIPEVTWDTLPE